MTTAIRLALIALAFVLLLGLGAWYYLFGPNKTSAAELVPSDTFAFATIPNAARLVADYQTSQLKKLLDQPDPQSQLDSLAKVIGPKNLDLLQNFLPELSGQSFLAVTHFDIAHPAGVGLIGGLKPKPGAGDFNGFVAKVKAAYPGVLTQGTTGNSQVEGLDYQWIQGPGASDKICVAQYRGWIIFGWGEDSLRDWWERLQKKATTPSLAQNPGYQKSLERVGIDSEAILYIDYHALIDLMQKQAARTNPASASYLSAKLGAIGAVAVGTKFEHGEIADHFSMLIPRQAQLDAGMPSLPCSFDTIKFTGPDTRLYYGSSANFSKTWQNFQEQQQLNGRQPVNPFANTIVTSLQNWARGKNLDVQRNIVGPLGNEFSLQAEWGSDSTYPEVGFFVKLDKSDDFKPTVTAILDTIRQNYATAAVINELNSGGQNFATLKFLQALPISPTITEDGPYFGLFLTENQAVNSFKRDVSVGLLNNPDFKRQIGDRQNGASQLLFIDTPQLLERGYQTALPYVPLAAMFNRTIGGLVKGRTLPPDIHWLDPIGTWSFVSSSDDDGVKGYSISGVGNQGFFLAGGIGAGFGLMSPFGLAGRTPFTAAPPPPPQLAPFPVPPSPPSSPAPSMVAPALSADATNTPSVVTPAPDVSTNQTTVTNPAPPVAPPTPAMAPPPDSTNSAPASAPTPATNSASEVTNVPPVTAPPPPPSNAAPSASVPQ